MCKCIVNFVFKQHIITRNTTLNTEISYCCMCIAQEIELNRHGPSIVFSQSSETSHTSERYQSNFIFLKLLFNILRTRIVEK